MHHTEIHRRKPLVLSLVAGAPRTGLVLAALLLASLGLSGCIDEFRPEAVSGPKSLLVVDGHVNLNGITTVRLSRTRNLNATVSPVEAKATVAIQDETGTRYPLAEKSPGTYASDSLVLAANHRYQLRLRTAAGRDYASDLVQGKVTPPIDRLSWAWENFGLQVYADAHDDTDNTRYYRWDYVETWEFHPPWWSEFEWVNGAIKRRTENVYNCWRSEKSTAVTISSTARLSRDVVAKFPLVLLPDNSEKLGVHYSILVHQYAQTQEEFSYWEKLKKNTESLGTLFDPLPTQLTGNVRCLTDANEVVLGYVGASTSTYKRLFIKRNELPATARFTTGYEECYLDTIPLPRLATAFSSPSYTPVHQVFDQINGIETLVGYDRTFKGCADCRMRGTNVKPSYWP